jgi:hypothetical protein
MSVSTTLRRHLLILQRLRKGPATKQEILDFIAARFEDDHDLRKSSPRTFDRDKADILTIFRTDIQYSHADKKYYLDETVDPQLSHRLLEGFDIANLLNLSESTAGHVLFEHRRPSGTEHFQSLLHAIRNKLMVQYNYQNYSDPEIKARSVYTHALKESKSRWYLLATETLNGKVKAFGLDRISNLEITKRTFKIPPGFNPDAQYRDCYGITSPNSDAPDDVVLSFEPLAGRYVKSFPLHHSQQVIVDNEQEIRISLKVYLTREFIMEILSYGASVKVLAPTKLKSLIKDELLKAMQQMDEGQPSSERKTSP